MQPLCQLMMHALAARRSLPNDCAPESSAILGRTFCRSLDGELHLTRRPSVSWHKTMTAIITNSGDDGNDSWGAFIICAVGFFIILMCILLLIPSKRHKPQPIDQASRDMLPGPDDAILQKAALDMKLKEEMQMKENKTELLAQLAEIRERVQKLKKMKEDYDQMKNSGFVYEIFISEEDAGSTGSGDQKDVRVSQEVSPSAVSKKKA